MDLSALKIMAVHAHPDDESLWTGMSLHQWARRGAEVTVVTCTLGEEGEVIGDKYQNLTSGDGAALGGYRIAELQRALGYLGVGAPIFLGGLGKWRDSGMVGSDASQHPRAFVHSGEEGVEDLLALLREYEPDILITYGPDGGYGHPDHIRAHEITHQAVQRQWEEQGRGAHSIYWAVTEQEKVETGYDNIQEIPHQWRLPHEGEIAWVPAEQVSARVYGSYEDMRAKYMAMKAHATQLWLAENFYDSFIIEGYSDVNTDPARALLAEIPSVFCLSNLIAQPLIDTESYTQGWVYTQLSGNGSAAYSVSDSKSEQICSVFS